MGKISKLYRYDMKILLLSGGADSMLLYQQHKFDKTIFFDYGQEHLEEEFNCCSRIIDVVIRLPKLTKTEKEVNCRNLAFIINTVSTFGSEDIEIYLGTNTEDIYKDNNREFYNKVEDLINNISFNKVKIVTPLQDMSKQEILNKLELKFYTD